MRSWKLSLALCVSSLAMASPSDAATVITLTPPGLTSSATYQASTNGAFDDAYEFTAIKNGIVNVTIQTIGASAPTDVTFDPVTSLFNGSHYTYSGPSPVYEQLLKFNASVSAGIKNTFNVAGVSGDSGKYTINLSYAGVPEASTWAMMIIGFGFVGLGMRSRRLTIQPAVSR